MKPLKDIESEIRTLRLVQREDLRKDSAITLRAVPHVAYLRNFSKVQWDPSMMALPSIGRGLNSTLIASPTWAYEWLRKIDFLGDVPWDLPLFCKVPVEVWDQQPVVPSGLKMSEAFMQQGGFLNSWVEDDKTHLVWGRVEAESAQSILAFAWLQNVLAGGRSWRRRELGNLPEEFQRILPLGYMCLGKPGTPISLLSFGLPKPLLRLKNGSWVNTEAWIEIVAERISPVLTESIDMIIFPEAQRSREGRVMSMESKGNFPEGFYWKMTDNSRLASPVMIGLHPSDMGVEIDRFQEKWNEWLLSNVPELSSDRVTEVLLCLREALINADKHGCGLQSGRRMLSTIEKDSAARLLKIRVCDPGNGHRHNLNAPRARQDQERGAHLGLMLIHGLADHVRFYQNGSTIEFDFNCDSSAVPEKPL